MISITQRQVFHFSVLAWMLLLSSGSLAEVLVVSGAKNSAISLNKNQVGDVFLGKVTSLPDGRNATPIDQAESSPLRDEFYTKVANKSTSQAKAYWAKLSFTGRGMPPRECSDIDNVKKLLNSAPGAIGYIDRSSLDSSFNVILVLP